MDAWQAGRQIAKRLILATWEDSPSNVVLTGSATVSEGADAAMLSETGYLQQAALSTSDSPFAKVFKLTQSQDDDAPGRSRVARWRVYVVQLGHGLDGTTAPSRNATQGQGKSEGRTINEVVGRLLESAFSNGQLIDSTHGLMGRVVEVGRVVQLALANSVYQTIDLEVYTQTAARFYHPPRNLVATGGVGQVALTWVLPPTRFDTITTPILRRASGATAPTSVTSGTGVTLSAGATSVTDSGLAAGTYSYSIFMPYDETSTSPTTADRWSGATSVTSVTVT